MHVIAVSGFVYAVPEEAAIAEPAYFEHFAVDRGFESWSSDLFFEQADEIAHHETAFHMTGVRAYLEHPASALASAETA